MPHLNVNGTQREFPADAFPATLADLIQALELEPSSLVAEVEGEIVRAPKFADQALQPGMRVELVQFVGGG